MVTGVLVCVPSLTTTEIAAPGSLALLAFSHQIPSDSAMPLVWTLSTLAQAAFAIAAALYRRKATGEGQFLDVAMMDTAATMLAGSATPLPAMSNAVP